MSNRATSLGPKSQFTINLDLGWECQSLPSEENKKRKFPIEEWEEAKKGKKILDQGSEENKRNMQKGLWTRQYLDNTKLSPSKQKREGKGSHDLKWSSPFDCQPKSCASVTCSPHTKQKFPPNEPIPKTKSYWSMITYVVFDLIGNDLQSLVMTYLWFRIRMKHLPMWDWYTLSDFSSIFVKPSVSSKWSFRSKMLTSKVSFMVMRKFHQHALLPR